MIARKRTMPWTRVARASGGYAGATFLTNLVACTLPAMLICRITVALGALGGGGGAIPVGSAEREGIEGVAAVDNAGGASRMVVSTGRVPTAGGATYARPCVPHRHREAVALSSP